MKSFNPGIWQRLYAALLVVHLLVSYALFLLGGGLHTKLSSGLVAYLLGCTTIALLLAYLIYRGKRWALWLSQSVYGLTVLSFLLSLVVPPTLTPPDWMLWPIFIIGWIALYPSQKPRTRE